MRESTETLMRRKRAGERIAATIAASAKVATPERYAQVQCMVSELVPSRWEFGTDRWEMLVWRFTCEMALENEMPSDRDWLTPVQVEIVLAYAQYTQLLEAGKIDLPWNAYMRDLCFEMIYPN